jgi:hypothetical protein
MKQFITEAKRFQELAGIVNKNINPDLSINGVNPEDFGLEDTINYLDDEKTEIDYTLGWPRLYDSFQDKNKEDVKYIANDLMFILKRNPKMQPRFKKFIDQVMNII